MVIQETQSCSLDEVGLYVMEEGAWGIEKGHVSIIL